MKKTAHAQWNLKLTEQIVQLSSMESWLMQLPLQCSRIDKMAARGRKGDLLAVAGTQSLGIP